MFEVIVFVFLLFNLVYVVYGKKLAQKSPHIGDILYVLGQPMVMRLWPKGGQVLLSNEESLKLSQLYNPKKLESGRNHYLSRKIGLIYLVLAFGIFFALVLGKDFIEARPIETTIERPKFGEQALTIDLAYEVEDQGARVKQSMPLTIQAEVPSGDKALELLEAYSQDMVEAMLGDKGQQSYVVTDLVFDEEPFEVPIRVTYASMSPDYLTDQGELRLNRMLIGDAYAASVLVTMTLADRQIQNVYNFLLYRQPLSISEEMALVGDRVELQETQVLLPESLLERDLDLLWHRAEEGVKGSQIFALSVLLAVVIFFFKKEELNKALEDRKMAILIDFPDLVAKLTMLINAGMTFKRAWQKIVVDYQERGHGGRPLYEEMILTTTQIQNGMPEQEALELFGRRTGSKEVIRMTAILIQNSRRGNHSLSQALKQLSMEAWGIRTNSAKMLGEKASTKLLLPMGISFVTVIIIVLAPTLMSMKL